MLHLLLIMFFSFGAQAQTCRFETNAKVLKRSDGAAAFNWQQNQSLLFETNYEKSDRQVAWEKEIVSHFGDDYRVTLKNHIDIVARAISETSDEDFKKDLARSLYNAKLVYDGKVGRVRSLTCLEALTMEIHLGRFSVQSRTEFGLHVMAKNMLLSIYFDNLAALSQDGGFGWSNESKSEMDKDLKAGASHLIDLHLHPYNFDENPGDYGGELSPSVPDVKYWKAQKNLRRAALTNGFQTIEFTSDEIQQFQTD